MIGGPRSSTCRLFAAVLVTLGAACSGSGDAAQPGAAATHTGHGASGASEAEPAPYGEPDVAFGGPQGNTPQFVAECPFSHASPADPIVAPGQPDGGHEHVFFGAMGTDERSTAASLLAGGTTCDQQLDRSAYWAPALYDHGVEQVPDKVTAYYRPGPGVDPQSVKPYPFGLKIVAGGGHDRTRPPVSIASWTCGVSPSNEPNPPECPPDRGLRMIVTFPDCWDGVNTDSPDHRSHVVYSAGGRCPATHPVPVPQLTATFAYLITGPGHELSLASGSLGTLHADFFNAWDERKLATEVSACLNRGVVCGVTSSKT